MIRSSALALLLAATAIACSSLSAQEEQLVTSYTETAQQYYLMGDLDRANAQCLKGLAIDPDNDNLHLIQGWTLQRRGKTEDIAQAERLFRELQHTGDFRAILGLAEALERRGVLFTETAAAIRSGKKMTEAPDPEARMRELEEGARTAWEESLEKYTEALELQKRNPDAINGSMRIETLLGMNEQALTHAEQLVEVVREDREFWQQKTTTPGQLTAEQESRMREQIRAKTKLESAAHLHAAGLLVAMNRQADALKHLDAAAELDPDRADTFSRRAQTEKELGMYAEGMRDAKRFIALSPHSTSTTRTSFARGRSTAIASWPRVGRPRG
jgi:tetratricopeptide (TPR) repeat protein